MLTALSISAHYFAFTSDPFKSGFIVHVLFDPSSLTDFLYIRIYFKLYYTNHKQNKGKYSKLDDEDDRDVDEKNVCFDWGRGGESGETSWQLILIKFGNPLLNSVEIL